MSHALAQAGSAQSKGHLLLFCQRCYVVGMALTGSFVFPPASFPSLPRCPSSGSPQMFLGNPLQALPHTSLGGINHCHASEDSLCCPYTRSKFLFPEIQIISLQFPNRNLWFWCSIGTSNPVSPQMNLASSLQINLSSCILFQQRHHLAYYKPNGH
jgi:hypothetical protein